MKKVLFLTILPFLLLGTARVSAQVRIGGSGTPHSAAVLDLNADNETTPTGNQGGLALPRVELTANDMTLNGAAPVNGMLVYNTGGTLATGVYVWMTDKWVKTSTGSVAYTGSASIALDNGSFQREELTGDVTADKNSNQTTIGTGKVTSDHILNNTITANDIADLAITQDAIADRAIVNSKLANASVDSRTLGAMGATAGEFLAFNGSSWAPVAPAGAIGAPGGGRLIVITHDDGEHFTYDHSIYSVTIACRAGYKLIGNLYKVGQWHSQGDFYSPDGFMICAAKQACTCLMQTF